MTNPAVVDPTDRLDYTIAYRPYDTTYTADTTIEVIAGPLLPHLTGSGKTGL